MRTKYIPILLVVVMAFVFTCNELVICGEKKMSIKKQAFGKTKDGKEVDLYTLVNANGLKAKIMTYGGIVTSLKVPDRDGNLADIVLGYDSLDTIKSKFAFCYTVSVKQKANLLLMVSSILWQRMMAQIICTAV